jgi:hypothetical protein
MKWKVVSCMLLLACIMMQTSAIVARDSGTTTITGTVDLVTYEVSASSVCYDSAIVSWKTNGSATSRVFYDTQYHSNVEDYTHHTEEDPALVVEHSVALTGLLASTIYHYRVKSVAMVDGVEFVAISEDYVFTTLPTCVPPSVDTLCAWPVGGHWAILWGRVSDMGAASRVNVYFEWGTTADYDFETRHRLLRFPRGFVAIIVCLTPGTTYHFRAVAVGDGTGYGDDGTFTTWWWC